MNIINIKQIEQHLFSLLLRNNRNLDYFLIQTFKEEEITKTFLELKKSLQIIQKKIDQLSQKKWKQVSNQEKAAKERHDLYGNLTKINYGISYLKLSFPLKFKKKDQPKLDKIIALNKVIYQDLKTIFNQFSRKKLLIIEDDITLNEIYKNIFANLPIDVLLATDGYEAVEKAKNFIPNLIILDAIIPGLSGEKVLAMLNHDPQTKHIPVIITSNKDPDLITKLSQYPNVKKTIMKVEIDIETLKNIVISSFS
jgi:CheY-like chemotaxis protein